VIYGFLLHKINKVMWFMKPITGQGHTNQIRSTQKRTVFKYYQVKKMVWTQTEGSWNHNWKIPYAFEVKMITHKRITNTKHYK